VPAEGNVQRKQLTGGILELAVQLIEEEAEERERGNV